MKYRSVVVAGLLASSVIMADDINVTPNWQLLGATDGIAANVFDGKCVDFVWTFENNMWKVHIANGGQYNIPSNIGNLDFINRGAGFWIKGHDDCEIPLNDNNGGGANSSDLASLIDGKTLYIASQKTFEKLTFQFDDNKVSVIGSEDFDEPMDYEIDSGGNLIISGSKFTYVSDNDDYIEIIATNTPSSFVDDTHWIESSFGISVSSFENNANKLKDWFLENGLWDTTITADGKINKYDGVLCDGYWYIENNIFYFAYPEEDHLDFKAYKVENNQLLKQTDAPYSETVRFYYDQAERDAWYNTLISN